MIEYIICEKKKNSPRVKIDLCLASCDQKESCQKFLDAYFGMNPKEHDNAGGDPNPERDVQLR